MTTGRVCGTCAGDVPEAARFCPSCGTPQVVGATTEERRIVTVMFADIVGFTSLAERMDPEQVKRFVDHCLERLVEVVSEFGGRVDKMLGDGMLVLFGAPVAHEDDAERAVRAALRMQQVLDDGIRLRIGVNTGEVLVGTLAGSDYTAMGDVVNTASRLQTLAPVGGVLVGEATHELTSHTIVYETVGDLQAKGREQAVAAWLAVGASAPPGSRRRRDVPMVGRVQELAIGQAAIDLVMRHARGLVLHVDGDTGVGKSRLVDEYLDHLRTHGTTVLEGACVPYGESNVWYPLVMALPEAFGELGESPDVEAARGLVGDMLEAKAQEGPVALSIDDLQWADPVLVDLLDTVARRLSRLPFVLITAMRPGSDVEWPRIQERNTVVSLTLQPLTPEESVELAAELLDQPADPSTLSALYDRSGGNPLFLVELAALHHVDGELPGTLRALISARLDQLTPSQRRVIENASVLGTNGAVVGLQRFAEALQQPPPATAISDLDDLGLLVVRGDRWEFANEAVRDVAYQTLTKSARALRHAGVASSLEANHGGLDDLAHHAATAAELQQELGSVEGLPAALRATAVELLTKAADRALTSGSLRMSVRHTSRALDLVDANDHVRMARLLTLRGNAAVEQRDVRAASRDIEALAAIGERLADRTMTAEAHRMRGMLANSTGQMDVARRELGEAVDLLRQTDTPALLANALRQRGFIEMFTGSLRDAEWFFGEADGLFRQLGDERGLAYIEQHRAWLSFNAAEFDEARSRLVHAAKTLERLGDRSGVGWANGLLAFIEFFERNFDRAGELADLVTREADARGDDWAVGMMDTLRANLAIWQGRLDQALASAERARSRMRRLDDRFGLTQALIPLMRAQVALGRNASAQRTAEELMSLAKFDQRNPFPVLGALGAAMHRGLIGGALSMSEEIVAEAHMSQFRSFEPTVLLAALRAQAGLTEAALAAIDTLDDDTLQHPFAAAIGALVHTVNQLPERALELAARAVPQRGASYLDEVIARVAAAGAHAQLGHLDDAGREADTAAEIAGRVGDVPAMSLATTAYAAVTGRRHRLHDERATLGEGWINVLASLR